MWTHFICTKPLYKVIIAIISISQMRKMRLKEITTQGQTAGEAKHLTLPLSIKAASSCSTNAASSQPTQLFRTHHQPQDQPSPRAAKASVFPAKESDDASAANNSFQNASTKACEHCQQPRLLGLGGGTVVSCQPTGFWFGQKGKRPN